MRKLKAYKVIEDCENLGGIVFAYTAKLAREEAAKKFFDGELEGILLTREKWADQYAPGPVPIAKLMEHGWYFECWHCTRLIQEEMWDDDGENCTESDPVNGQHDSVFCTPNCMSDYRKGRNKTKIENLQHYLELMQATFEKIPHAIFDQESFSFYEIGHKKIKFKFPGAKYWGECGKGLFEDNDPDIQFSISAFDKPAYDKYKEELEKGILPRC